MGVNKKIIVAVLIIMASGLYTVLVIHNGSDPKRSSTVTKVVVGAYILGIVVSLVDLLGGPFGQVANALLLVALATALYAVIPDLAQRFQQRKA